jgi:hypothetical protein
MKLECIGGPLDGESLEFDTWQRMDSRNPLAAYQVAPALPHRCYLGLCDFSTNRAEYCNCPTGGYVLRWEAPE